MTETQKRPSVPEAVRLQVWVAAGGRCTFCNTYLLESEELGEAVPIGELAHNVGWGKKSPRGQSEASLAERSSAENLILSCRNCHKPVDQKGVSQRYTTEILARIKRKHEGRIKFLTSIGMDRAAFVLRMVGDIRGVSPELRRDTVMAAATSAGLYPRALPGASLPDIDLDLRNRGDFQSRDDFERCVPEIEDCAARVHDGVRRDDIGQVAVFGFARIPLLVGLGAALDDKTRTLVFQRQRGDGENSWRWPESPVHPVEFETILEREGASTGPVVLVASISGSIDIESLPDDVLFDAHVYVLKPVGEISPDPSLIRSPEGLANFEKSMRSFLSLVEDRHGEQEAISLFGALPLSCAVTTGRVLMAGVSPAWAVYDRDSNGEFFLALEVKR
jgi:hypothetical protein